MNRANWSIKIVWKPCFYEMHMFGENKLFEEYNDPHKYASNSTVFLWTCVLTRSAIFCLLFTKWRAVLPCFHETPWIIGNHFSKVSMKMGVVVNKQLIFHSPEDEQIKLFETSRPHRPFPESTSLKRRFLVLIIISYKSCLLMYCLKTCMVLINRKKI